MTHHADGAPHKVKHECHDTDGANDEPSDYPSKPPSTLRSATYGQSQQESTEVHQIDAQPKQRDPQQFSRAYESQNPQHPTAVAEQQGKKQDSDYSPLKFIPDAQHIHVKNGPGQLKRAHCLSISGRPDHKPLDIAGHASPTEALDSKEFFMDLHSGQ
ncbi:uncharacterized protein BCR38DRAFT_433148 [Pseudomassariella vexata]|uniref:Uncharacterized protein n=1 Tax=Pseudomassariella vexata TaxID=1141098 RepID=A0A1Y2E2L9_9PEZI|nr:uncharacterized protein BCR38DRAFT_433148 [Pseudomassariella vexata]ORY65566.1 hypothetical protein BCR38DRAFT_433148 [Pseudomassariella vexata]